MPMFLLGFWGWLKKVPGEVWIALCIVAAVLIGIYTVDRNAVKRTKKEEEVEDLKDTVVLQETSKEILNDIETRVEHADEAVARFPQLRSRDGLRTHDPELAAIILDDPD